MKRFKVRGLIPEIIDVITATLKRTPDGLTEEELKIIFAEVVDIIILLIKAKAV